MVFGALITPTFLFGEIPLAGWIFAIVAIVAARPAALFASFLGSKLALREQLAAMWFGPKGFASVVYGLIVLHSGIARADHVPPDRAGHCPLDPGPLLDRRGDRPAVR